MQQSIIADVYNSGEHTFDSSVYLLRGTNQKKIIKIYDLLSRSTIEEYHRIQNNLSKKKYTLITEISDDIFITQNQHKHRIDKILIEVLHLGNDLYNASDIDHKHEVVVSEIPYINGDTLLDVGLYNESLLMKIEDIILYPDIDKESVFEIEDTDVGMNGFLKTMRKLLKSERSKFLTSMNIKVIKIEGNIVHLIITDLGNSIGNFVRHFRSSKKR